MGDERDHGAPRLNEQQEAVVAHDEGALLILGVAGSGRTEALARRLARLVGSGDRALVLTRSVATARQIRTRAEATIETALRGARRPHPPGGRRAAAPRARDRGRDRPVLRVTEPRRAPGDAARPHRRAAIARHEIRGNPAGLLARIVDRIDALKSAGVTAERFGRWADEQAGGTRSERDSAAREREFAEIYERHDSMLRSAGAMDDIDAVLELTRLLGERPALGGSIAERFPHLLVDELEDACPAERSLIEALARGASSAVLSCDDEQGRGPCDAASAWARQAIEPREVALEPTWRYGGDLLDAAHAVVAPASRGADVPRRAAGPPTRVRFWCGTNERAEAQAVARDIEGALAAGEVKMEEICVAVPRGGGPARAIAAALEERRVPYRLSGPGAFFQRPEVRDVIAWLRLLADPTDAAAAVRALSRPPVELRSVDLARCTTIARRRKLDMVSALEASLESPQIPPEARDRIREFLQLHRAAARADGRDASRRLRAPADREDRLPATSALRRAPRGGGAPAQPLAPRRAGGGLDAPRAGRFEPRLRPLPGGGFRGGGRARRGAERADRRRDQGDAAGADQGARVHAGLRRRPARRGRAGLGARRPARRSRRGRRPRRPRTRRSRGACSTSR